VPGNERFGADGIAVFQALRRRRKATDAMLNAFDLLELNGMTSGLCR
jgi:ATP-dependent DNA ligase